MAKENSLKELQNARAVLVAQLDAIIKDIEQNNARVPGRRQSGMGSGEFFRLQREFQDIVAEIRSIDELIRLKLKGKQAVLPAR